MMKRMSRYSRTSRLLVLLLCALLLAGMLPSFGALGATKTKKNSSGAGSLTVSLKTDVKKLPKDAEVEFTLYKIGNAAPKTAAGWTFDAPFGEYGNKIIAAEDESSLQGVVNDLAAEIVKGNYAKMAKTLSNGSAEFTGLADGVYIGVLTKAPKGLTANASLITIPSWNADKSDWLYKVPVKIKDTYTGDLTISKSVVSPYEADRNATYSFTVTLTENINGPFKTTPGPDVVFTNGKAKVSVKGDESVTITGLPYGIGYTVAETYVNGFRTASNGATGTIAVGQRAVFTNTRDTDERTVPGVVTVNKVDVWNRIVEEGATFTLYADEGLTREITSYSGSSFEIRTSDADLKAYLPAPGQTATYYLAETIAPTGYDKATTPLKVVIGASESSTIENNIYVTITTYSIKIEAQDTANVVNNPKTGVDREDDAVTVTKTDGRKQITGATFTLYDGNKPVTTFTGGRFRISTADEALKDVLPAVGATRTLTLKETGVPAGYKGSDDEYEVTISATEATYWNEKHTRLITTTTYSITINGEKSVIVVNPPVTDDNRKDDAVTVRKTDGSRMITGATFTLYDGRKEVATFSGGTFEISTANEKLKGCLPAVGHTKTLTLKETVVPKGYTGSIAEYTVVISAKKETSWNKDHSKLVATTIYTISIDGKHKLEVSNTPITEPAEEHDFVTVHKVDEAKRPLKGAEFTLYSGDKAIATYGGSKVDSFIISTTDKELAQYLPSNGNSVTLTLKETKAPTGYIKTGDEYKVVLTTRVYTEWNADHTKLITWTVYDISIGDEAASLTVANEPEFTPTPTPVPTTTPTASSTPVPTNTPSTSSTPVPTNTPPTSSTPAPTGTPTASSTPAPSGTPIATATPVPTPTATEPPEGGGGGGGAPVPPAPTPTPTVEISGTKVWDDEGNIHKTRPDSIQVTLYADNSPVNAQPSWSRSGDRWTFTFSGLPKYNGSGSEITYTVKETPVNRYESSVSGLTITNKLIPSKPEKYTDLSGEKVWKDNDNNKGKRPSTIIVRLYRDGVEVENRTVTAGTGWKYTFQNLPVDDGYGNIYTYEVREDGVSGYFSRIEGTTLINSLIDGSTPPRPTDDGETPPPNGTVPNVPERPEDIPERKTGTPVPPFEEMDDEELEELFDMFGYGTPLYGMFGTGDQIPVWVWICAGIGILALVIAIVMGRKRKSR